MLLISLSKFSFFSSKASTFRKQIYKGEVIVSLQSINDSNKKISSTHYRQKLTY